MTSRPAPAGAATKGVCWCFNHQGKPMQEKLVESFSKIFDGEKYEIVYGEDFFIATHSWEGWEEPEEEEDLDPYEHPDRKMKLTRLLPIEDPKMPFKDRERAWGILSVFMASLCRIIQTERDQYQHNIYQNAKVADMRFTFKSKRKVQERI